jgi:hypothetical protein
VVVFAAISDGTTFLAFFRVNVHSDQGDRIGRILVFGRDFTLGSFLNMFRRSLNFLTTFSEVNVPFLFCQNTDCATFWAICATFWAICATFLAICATFWAICATFWAICATFWAICATFWAICATFLAICATFLAICATFWAIFSQTHLATLIEKSKRKPFQKLFTVTYS